MKYSILKHNYLKIWERYCKFSDSEIQRNKSKKYLINHYFFYPIKPAYKIIKILKEIENLKVFNKIFLKCKFYLNLIIYFFNLTINQYFKNKAQFQNFNKCLKKKYDYVIVSHLNNSERLLSDKDPYYGDILKEIKRNKQKVLLVLIPHIFVNHDSIKKFLNKNKSYDVHILSDYFSFRSKKSIISSILKERKRLLKISKKYNNYKKNLYIYAAETIISKANQKNLDYSSQIYKIIKETSSTNLITTFEGHSWERLFYYHAKLANNKLICIGYQHTNLFKYNSSIYREMDSFYNPNIIWTSGKITMEIFRKIFVGNTKIELLGTHKFHKKSFESDLINENNGVLFLPSGEIEEAKYITEYAIKFALENPDLNIYIRYHPIIKKHFKKIKGFKNFCNSKLKLEDDCKRSRWAIYSSSTAIFEAIQFGCMPINLLSENLITINDPLWQLKTTFIKRVYSKTELRSEINLSNSSNKEKLNFEYKLLLDEINELWCEYNQKLY